MKYKPARRKFYFWHWYSVCSRHMLHHYDTDCPACNSGSWVFSPTRKIGSWVYKHYPDVWRKWANRPNSKLRKNLKKHFPGLR